jgi:hypothetical protein
MRHSSASGFSSQYCFQASVGECFIFLGRLNLCNNLTSCLIMACWLKEQKVRGSDQCLDAHSAMQFSIRIVSGHARC